MRYLVTGGAGFIGTNIVKQLIADGHEVIVLDNYSSGKKEDRIQKGAQYIEGDIRTMSDLQKAMQGVQGVFHLAAVPRVPYSVEHPLETNEHNITGTLNILVAARDAKVKRVVFSSSSSVYGGDKGEIALQEDMLPSPKSPYALQKLTGEHYCRLFAELYDLQTVSLRYFNIYGPYLDPEGAYALVIGKFLRQRVANEPLTICGDGEYYRDYTHVSDVVRANILAMSKDTVGNGEIINIGNSQPYSVNQVASLIGGTTSQIPPRAGDVRYSRANITKAKQLLGWEPTVALQDGISELKKIFGII
ncbi:MAG: NAD-dependent epimerase/dehydratase [Candidatus Magasanikbacteria bacterium GW2011_GWA2_45_39]|uniref:NAD-dependent epimerase/dehydratase n=2 Tax=Candidatus Magasanikiibacteriota TaxID=1752731 RepID=A0A0G1Q4L9_9BACT|nr:MAG: NAD-dependent epimerase/dehydratase [Candidatus Magasanikbacteria bacterium GW2011_GWA2_45_39]KKU12633.1 MAG: NAD-dependent epimerase/dehydratase [Candidatus Magasanikbacteria bacterium GW2011_GWC2_45_8]HBW74402.1 LPS biosynthesis protein WbpP [Candidatus Magasanikbacteria bacterium]